MKLKSLVVLIAVMALTSVSSLAQKTIPRYGTAPNQNNTYSNLTLGLQYKTDTLGATTDTVLITPNAYHTDVVFTVKDSCVFSLGSVKSSWLGDNMTVILENTSGSSHFVNFLGYSGLTNKWGMASTGTKISLASGKAAVLTFSFDGVYWYEKSRVIQ